MLKRIKNKINNGNTYVRRKGDWFFDCIWPAVPPKFLYQIEKQKKHDQKRLKNDLEVIENLKGRTREEVEKAYNEIMSTVKDERERIIRVETKLAALLLLAAVSATLVLSVGNLTSLCNHWSVIIVMGYCLMQLIRTLFAVLEGIKRRRFYEPTLGGILRVLDIKKTDNIHNMMTAMIEGYHHNQNVGNNKVTTLAIAHCSVRNFLVGLSVLFILLVALPKNGNGELKQIGNSLKKLSTQFDTVENIKSNIKNTMRLQKLDIQNMKANIAEEMKPINQMQRELLSNIKKFNADKKKILEKIKLLERNKI